MEKQLPERIKNWLNARGISNSILETYEIGFENNHIVIPVHDFKGEHLFNKYRRDPESTDGPKYKYEKGSSSALYGLKTYAWQEEVFICEGEFDCLALLSRGITALSSTGGSGTFEKEWVDTFINEKGDDGIETYICYDNDEAGIKGAFHVQSIIPWAKIIWLPKQVGEHGDVTDFFVKLGKSTEDFLALRETAETYELPKDWGESATKKELKTLENEYKIRADALLIQARELREEYQSDRHIQILLQMYLNKMSEVKRVIKYFDKPKFVNGDRIKSAKQVPIPRYIKFNTDGFAKCIWHNEHTPSMYYYESQNVVKCFSCDKRGDVIDVVRQMNNCGIDEALKIILNEK